MCAGFWCNGDLGRPVPSFIFLSYIFMLFICTGHLARWKHLQRITWNVAFLSLAREGRPLNYRCYYTIRRQFLSHYSLCNLIYNIGTRSTTWYPGGAECHVWSTLLPLVRCIPISFWVVIRVLGPPFIFLSLMLSLLFSMPCTIHFRVQFQQLRVRRFIIRFLTVFNNMSYCRFTTSLWGKTYPPPVIILPLCFSISRYSSMVIVGNLQLCLKTPAFNFSLCSTPELLGRIVKGRKTLPFVDMRSDDRVRDVGNWSRRQVSSFSPLPPWRGSAWGIPGDELTGGAEERISSSIFMEAIEDSARE